MINTLKLSLVFLIFLGVSAVYTSPLYRHLDNGFAYTANASSGNEVVPFREGDSVQLYYHFWMAWDYVTGGPGPFFRDPYEFKMGADSEGVFTTRRLLISLLFLLLAPAGTVFAFNLLILLCVALSGFMTFLLAKHYTNQFIPSFLAGLVFSIFPFALGQILGGHTNGFVMFLVPFMLWCFEKGIATSRNFYFLLSSIGFACFALIEYHLLYYMCLLTPFFFLFRLIQVRPGWKNFFRAALSLGVAMGIGVAIMFVIKAFEISGSIRAEGVSLREINLYSPNWRYFFFRPEAGMEKMIYLGFVPLVGSLISFLIFGWRRPLFWLYAGILAFFGLLCLGLTLDAKLPIYRFFYENLPYFSLSRLPGRMVVFVALAAGMLLAMGAARIKKGTLLALVLVAVIVVDYFPRSAAGITLLPPKSKVYEFVKENIGDKNLLCLPIWPGDTSWSSIYLYYVTQTKVPLVNGYYPVVPEDYVEKVFYPLYSLNVGEVRPVQAALLQKLNVGYVVFHEEAFPGKVSHFPAQVTLSNLFNNPYLHFVFQDNKHWLFELLKEPRSGSVKEVKTPIGIYLKGEKLHRGNGFKVDHRIQILPPGKYIASFRLSGKGANGIPLTLLGNDPLKRENRHYVDLELLASSLGTAGETQVPFTLKKAQLVTLQVGEKEALQVESIVITLANQTKSPTLLEAESLFTHGLIVNDMGASGGKAICGFLSDMPQTELLYGPYRLYPAGDYQVRFWVKPSPGEESKTLICADSTVAQLEVVSNYGRNILAKKPLLALELLQEDKFHPVEVSFSIDKDEVLEFRVPFLRQTGICIDKVEVVQK